MSIMRGTKVSTKVVDDNYPKETEAVVAGIKADKKDAKYTGIADSASYNSTNAMND